MKKKLLISMAMILFLATGCGKVAKLENGQDAVVTFKGNEISVDHLYSEMKDRYALSVLLDMIDEKILNDKYKDDDEQKESVENQIQAWVQIYGRGDEATLLQQTASSLGVTTMDGLRDYFTLQYKRNLAAEDYAKTLVEDDEIEKYYDEKIFGDISAKHILIKPKTKDGMTTDEKTAAEEAALQLKDGEYTKEPVKSTYGYHIILRVSQKEKPQLKTVRSDIVDELYKDKMTEDKAIQIIALEKLRKEYKINIEDKTLKTQYENYLVNSKNSAREEN